MTTKIGPIQTGEEKPAAFDFTDEEISGSLVSAVVTISVAGGAEDPDFIDVLVGSPIVTSPRVVQKVAYQVPDVTYLLQCTALDSGGFEHTISAYMPSKAVY